MKINRPELINLIHKIYKPAQPNAAAKQEAAPGAADRLEISTEIAELKKALAKLPETDPARLEKLTKLAQQIENNEYRVDPDELAALLMQQLEEK